MVRMVPGPTTGSPPMDGNKPPPLCTALLLLPSEPGVGVAHRRDERLEPIDVLLAGDDLDTARDVDGVGANGRDRRADILRREPAGEDDPAVASGRCCRRPVGGPPASSV